VKEMVEDGVTGRLFFPGEAARKSYETKYSPEKNYKMLMEICKRALAEEHWQRFEIPPMRLSRRSFCPDLASNWHAV
jgi:hypothetical protein